MNLKHNPENEPIKHRYRVWLQDAQGRSDASIDQSLAAIEDFEAFTKFKPFRLFHIESARAFTRDLRERRHPKSNKLLSKATVNGKLGALRRFIQWLGGQPEGRRRIGYGDADYFRLSEKDARIARATRPKRVPTVEDVRRAIFAMPADSPIQCRDRAIVTFALLTCARVSAIASARLKNVDVQGREFFQDARDVRTKRSKTFPTWFFPVGDDVRTVIEDWISYLTNVAGFGPEDPVFPRTLIVQDEHRRFMANGLSRDPWLTTDPIRDIFRRAFKAAGLPPPNPHLMRDTIAQLGAQVCRTAEEYKAWSQNMGHDKPITTLTAYGTVAPDRQAAIIRGLMVDRTPHVSGDPDPETVQWVLDHLGRNNRQKGTF